jgi:hypothetical protein
MRWAILVLAGLLACSAASAERVTDPHLGLAIETPSDWSELPTTEVNKDFSSLDKDDPELAEAVRTHGFIPIHLLGRNPKPHSLFSATVNISIPPAAPLKGQSDQQVLLAFLTSSAQQLPNAKLVTAPEIITLGGRPAGHMTLTFPLKIGDNSIPVTTEVWAIQRAPITSSSARHITPIRPLVIAPK